MLRRLFMLMALSAQPALAVDYLLYAPGNTEPAEVRVNSPEPKPGRDMPANYKALVWVPEIDRRSGQLERDYRKYHDMGPMGARLYIPPVDDTPPPVVPNLSGFLDVVVGSGLFSDEEILQILVVSKIDDKQQRDKFILLFLSKAAPEKQGALAALAKENNIELPGGGN